MEINDDILNSLTEMERAIGYSFNDKSLLEAAITHSSYAYEHNLSIAQYNERLEFLGDAVLELIASEYLYNELKDRPEGVLTKARAALVMGQALAVYAQAVGIDKFLRLGRGEEASGGRKRPSILADAFEAVIGAIYLDGGYSYCRDFVTRFFEQRQKAINPEAYAGDYKTVLQETVQMEPGSDIEYRVIRETGPEHQKTFIVEVLINGRPMGQGVGTSKKEAEQNAARKAVEELTE
jgi:ribonuclease-3